MKLYVQLMIILCFSFAGEAISTLLRLPVPGSIIGLLLLFIALEMKWIRLRHIDKVGVISFVVRFIKNRYEGDFEEGK